MHGSHKSIEAFIIGALKYLPSDYHEDEDKQRYMVSTARQLIEALPTSPIVSSPLDQIFSELSNTLTRIVKKDRGFTTLKVLASLLEGVISKKEKILEEKLEEFQKDHSKVLQTDEKITSNPAAIQSNSLRRKDREERLQDYRKLRESEQLLDEIKEWQDLSSEKTKKLATFFLSSINKTIKNYTDTDLNKLYGQLQILKQLTLFEMPTEEDIQKTLYKASSLLSKRYKIHQKEPDIICLHLSDVLLHFAEKGYLLLKSEAIKEKRNTAFQTLGLYDYDSLKNLYLNLNRQEYKPPYDRKTEIVDQLVDHILKLT